MADLPEKPAQGTPTAASVRAEVEQKEVREVAYSGPLPPPEMLNQFDPETRAAIVADFTAHSVYRREISHQALASTVDLARRARDRVTLIAIGGLVVAAVIAAAGQPLWGVLLAALDIGGGVAVALLQRQHTRSSG